jgi:hypothetical protein
MSVLLAGILSLLQEPSPNLDHVLASYDAACQAVPDFDMRINDWRTELLAADVVGEDQVRFRPYGADEPHKVRVLSVTRQRHLNGKYRVDWLQDGDRKNAEGTFSLVWDGGTGVLLNTGQRSAEIAPIPPAFSGVQALAYFRLFRDYGHGYSFSQFIRDRWPKSSSIRQSAGLVLIRCEPQAVRHTGSPSGLELSLNPNRGFMPEQIDFLMGKTDDAVVRMRIRNELSEVLPGVWLPVRSRLSSLVTDQKSQHFGVETVMQEYEVDATRSRWGVLVDDAVFELEIPVGTDVRDRIRGAVYQAGAETREQYLDTLASIGRLSLEETKSRSLPVYPPQQVSMPLGKLLLIWLNVVGLACILGWAAYWLWHRRLGRRSQYRT